MYYRKGRVAVTETRHLRLVSGLGGSQSLLTRLQVGERQLSSAVLLSPPEGFVSHVESAAKGSLVMLSQLPRVR